MGERLELAVRYALSLPGVASANLGVNTAEQLLQDVEIVRRFTPLSDAEMAAALEAGRPLAREWGAHYGPATE
jgi:predicted aldo/keto reductase-like oxidoreductase